MDEVKLINPFLLFSLSLLFRQSGSAIFLNHFDVKKFILSLEKQRAKEKGKQDDVNNFFRNFHFQTFLKVSLSLSGLVSNYELLNRIKIAEENDGSHFSIWVGKVKCGRKKIK